MCKGNLNIQYVLSFSHIDKARLHYARQQYSYAAKMDHKQTRDLNRPVVVYQMLLGCEYDSKTVTAVWAVHCFMQFIASAPNPLANRMDRYK